MAVVGTHPSEGFPNAECCLFAGNYSYELIRQISRMYSVVGHTIYFGTAESNSVAFAFALIVAGSSESALFRSPVRRYETVATPSAV